MRINAKIVVSAIAWTAAVGAALGRTVTGTSMLTVWALLAAAVAAVATAALVVDYVAGSTAKFILTEIVGERDATVAATVKAIHKYGEPTADRIVSRLADKQDKTIERITRELVNAMGEEAPTPFKRR